MSVYLDVVCSESNLSPAEDRQQKLRVIGEILPFVFAKYGISGTDPRAQVRRNAEAAPRPFSSQPRFSDQRGFRDQPRFRGPSGFEG